MRTRRALITSLVAAVVFAAHATAGSAGDTTLKAYLARMGVQMNAYRAALARADHAFDDVPARVAAARFTARSAEFKRIAGQVKPVRAPHGLAGQHAKLTRALELVASAFKGFAAARRAYAKNHSQAAAIAANTRQHAKLRTAQTLEVGWAKAVRARTVKAHLVMPAWLRAFFTS